MVSRGNVRDEMIWRNRVEGHYVQHGIVVPSSWESHIRTLVSGNVMFRDLDQSLLTIR